MHACFEWSAVTDVHTWEDAVARAVAMAVAPDEPCVAA